MSIPGPVVTVAINGKIIDYPDRTPEFEQWTAAGNPLAGVWTFMAGAQEFFRVWSKVDEITGWVHLDDQPVAYLIEVRRRPGFKIAAYKIIGASRMFTTADD